MSCGSQVGFIIYTIIAEGIAFDVDELVIREIFKARMTHETFLMVSVSKRFDNVSRKWQKALVATAIRVTFCSL